MRKPIVFSGLPLLFLGALSVPGAAFSDVITDGSLEVNIDNTGEFNVIRLNGTDIDTSGFVQQYVGNTCDGFSGGSAINTAGDTSTYTASCGSFDITVTSTITGPLASNPAVSNQMRQQIVFTNNTGGALTLESISNIDQDLQGSGGDIVAFDAARQAVVATDPTAAAPDTLLMAAAASTECPSGIFGYDVDTLGNESVTFPMDNGGGPVGPSDTAMSIGYDCGSVGPGESRTITFDYLFATDLSAVPSDFPSASAPPSPSEPQRVPTLSDWAMIIMASLLGMVAFGRLRRRSD